jgi:hypothetical protein
MKRLIPAVLCGALIVFAGSLPLCAEEIFSFTVERNNKKVVLSSANGMLVYTFVDTKGAVELQYPASAGAANNSFTLGSNNDKIWFKNGSAVYTIYDRGYGYGDYGIIIEVNGETHNWPGAQSTKSGSIAEIKSRYLSNVSVEYGGSGGGYQNTYNRELSLDDQIRELEKAIERNKQYLREMGFDDTNSGNDYNEAPPQTLEKTKTTKADTFFTLNNTLLIISALVIALTVFLIIFFRKKENAGNPSAPKMPAGEIRNNPPTAETLAAGQESQFDGGLSSYIGWSILGFLVTVVTLGICYPWALCMTYGWRINHTVIKGRRLKFTGRAVDLFGHWLLWIFLTIITLGIYSFWLFIALEKWRVKNTAFETL